MSIKQKEANEALYDTHQLINTYIQNDSNNSNSSIYYNLGKYNI